MALRPLAESDLTLILRWRNSPLVRKSMYTQHEISQQEHAAWFERMCLDPSSLFYVHSNKDGIADGVVYFNEYSTQQATAFWGFYLGDGAKKGASSLLGFEGLDKGFRELKLHKINSDVLSDNVASLNFHSRLGFREEGVFKEHYFDGAHHIDIVRFGLLSEEWEAQRESLL